MLLIERHVSAYSEAILTLYLYVTHTTGMPQIEIASKFYSALFETVYGKGNLKALWTFRLQMTSALGFSTGLDVWMDRWMDVWIGECKWSEG